MFLDTDYNPNNRTWQYYLNLIKMYNFSLFANGVIFATEEPTVAITGLSYGGTTSITIDQVADTKGLDIIVTPVNANSPTITYESNNEQVFTVVADSNNDRHCTITATGGGTATLTVKADNVTTTLDVTVPTNA